VKGIAMRTRFPRAVLFFDIPGALICVIGLTLSLTAACKEKHGAAPRASSGARKASVTVGPISTTYEAGSKVATTYAEVDAMLKPFLSVRSGQIRLVRA
jgi:hypothetical protein